MASSFPHSRTVQDAVVEWSRVRQSLIGLDASTAKEYLISFFEMDGDKDGRLSLEVNIFYKLLL